MPSNPKVVKAFRAMKNIGISPEKVKPVLKDLLKLYDKNWELIEEENYRVLADAIFEKEEATESQKPENIQEEVLEEEAADEEPERPLKRLRSRHQEVHSSSISAGTSFKKVEEQAELPGTNSQGCSQGPELNNRNAAAESQSVPCLTYVRKEGKQPVSPNSADRLENNAISRKNRLKGKETQTPQIISKEKGLVLGKASRASILKKPKTEPDIEILGTHDLIKPKDEPHTVDMPQLEVPLAVIHPEPSNDKGSSNGNASRKQPDTSETSAAELRGGREADKDIPTFSNGLVTSHELVKPQNQCYSNIDVASSTFGEVKLSINCDAALGRSDFHLPSLEAVVKLVEDKCLKPFKILDPNFSVPKLMKDMCECFLELGTQYNHELQETAKVDAENDIGYRSMALVSPSIGISNYDIFLTRDCLAYSKVKPAVNQIETHPYFQRESLVKFCQKHGICVTAHTPLGGAAANTEWFGSVSCLEDPALKGLAEKYKKTVAQVILRWGIQRNTVVIPKSSKLERLQENFNVLDFELTKEDMDLIKSLDRNYRTNQPAKFWGIDLYA